LSDLTEQFEQRRQAIAAAGGKSIVTRKKPRMVGGSSRPAPQRRVTGGTPTARGKQQQQQQQQRKGTGREKFTSPAILTYLDDFLGDEEGGDVKGAENLLEKGSKVSSSSSANSSVLSSS
jgi:hypothetical protein